MKHSRLGVLFWVPRALDLDVIRASEESILVGRSDGKLLARWWIAGGSFSDVGRWWKRCKRSISGFEGMVFLLLERESLKAVFRGCQCSCLNWQRHTEMEMDGRRMSTAWLIVAVRAAPATTTTATTTTTTTTKMMMTVMMMMTKWFSDFF